MVSEETVALPISADHIKVRLLYIASKPNNSDLDKSGCKIWLQYVTVEASHRNTPNFSSMLTRPDDASAINLQ